MLPPMIAGGTFLILSPRDEADNDGAERDHAADPRSPAPAANDPRTTYRTYFPFIALRAIMHGLQYSANHRHDGRDP